MQYANIHLSTSDVVIKCLYDIVICFVVIRIFKCNVVEVQKIYVSNRLLELKHIAVKSRENDDEENCGGVEQLPLLGPSADTNCKGIYWSNAQNISNRINTVFYF